jgi:hypothetical protein
VIKDKHKHKTRRPAAPIFIKNTPQIRKHVFSWKTMTCHRAIEMQRNKKCKHVKTGEFIYTTLYELISDDFIEHAQEIRSQSHPKWIRGVPGPVNRIKIKRTSRASGYRLSMSDIPSLDVSYSSPPTSQASTPADTTLRHLAAHFAKAMSSASSPWWSWDIRVCVWDPIS